MEDLYRSALDRAPLAEIERLLGAVSAHELSTALRNGPSRLTPLAGLGAELWRSLDVPTYLDELRDDWDARRTPGHLP